MRESPGTPASSTKNEEWGVFIYVDSGYKGSISKPQGMLGGKNLSSLPLILSLISLSCHPSIIGAKEIINSVYFLRVSNKVVQ